MGNTTSTSLSCCICLDKKNKGFLCYSGHFTCKQCFSPYITSTCENAGKLCDNGFLIRCPYPTCRSDPWSVAQLRANLDKNVLDFYISTLIRFSSKLASGEGVEDIKKDSLVKRVTAALSLSCPKCKSVLDQNPEGCCAIRCNICASHFCWLCFQTQKDSTTCHNHINRCCANPSRRLFATDDVREVAHKAFKIRNIQSNLIEFHRVSATRDADNGATGLIVDWTQNPTIIATLTGLEPLLAQNEITPDEILVSEQNGLFPVMKSRFQRDIQRLIKPLVVFCVGAFNQFRATQMGAMMLHYFGIVNVECTRLWNILVPKHEIIQFVAKYIIVTMVWRLLAYVFGVPYVVMTSSDSGISGDGTDSGGSSSGNSDVNNAWNYTETVGTFNNRSDDLYNFIDNNSSIFSTILSDCAVVLYKIIRLIPIDVYCWILLLTYIRHSFFNLWRRPQFWTIVLLCIAFRCLFMIVLDIIYFVIVLVVIGLVVAYILYSDYVWAMRERRQLQLAAGTQVARQQQRRR